MLILDDHNQTIILDNIHTPLTTNFFWVLDLDIQDFTIVPLLVLEEIIIPSIEIKIDGFCFTVPANWNILISDNETTQLDSVEISELAGKEFQALVYGPNKATHDLVTIVVNDYFPTKTNVGPSLNKHQMLCHPISPTSWINIAPSDSFNKYLKNKSIGDII